MDRFYYREILKRNLLPSIANYGFSGGFTFMYDNDLKHTSALVKDWLIKQYMKTLPWSSYSGRIGEKTKGTSAKKYTRGGKSPTERVEQN